MKIAIEGPNNVGKSTFIKMLKERTSFKDYEVEHLSHLTPNDYKFHDDLLNTDGDMIFDRFFLGELVYPNIYNRESKLNVSDVIKICKNHKDDLIIVSLDADYEFIIQANNNKKEFFNYEEVKKEKSGFKNAVKALKDQKISILSYKNHRVDNDDLEKFIDLVESLVASKKVDKE